MAKLSKKEIKDLPVPSEFVSDGFDFPLGNSDNYPPWEITLGLGKSWDSHFGHLGEDYLLKDKKGINISNGQPVYACSNGMVVFAGNGGKNWGDVILIKCQLPEGRIIYYQPSHLERLFVKEKQGVKRDQLLGYITKLPAWEAHLHLEFKYWEAIEKESNFPVGKGYSGKNGYAPNRESPSKFIKENRRFPLKVLSTYPENGAKNVSPKIEPAIRFNQPLDPETVQEAITISPAGTIGEYILYQIPSKGPPKLVLEKPDKVKYTDFYFWPETTFTIRVSTKLKNQSGVSLSEPFEFRFTIGLDRILFCLEEGGQTALWTINPDGSGLARRQDWAKNGGKPSFSPDGSKIVFHEEVEKITYGICESERKALYLMDFVTGETRTIFNKRGISASRPVFSPDGKKIAFSYFDPFTYPDRVYISVWMMDVNSENAKDLAQFINGDFISPVAWSPNGEQLACQDETDLFIVDVDRGKYRNITRNSNQIINALHYSWSPDGKWFAFLSNDRWNSVLVWPDVWPDDWYDLYLIRPNGQDRKMMIGDLRYFKDLDWSKDSRQLVVLVGPYTPPNSTFTDKKGQYQLVLIDVQNPSQRKTIFTQRNCKIHWIMWNSFRANF